jgi:hypothetical protein
MALLVCTLIFVITHAQPAAADEAKLWLPVTIQFEPRMKRILGSFEVQPRFDEDVTGTEALLVRPAVGLEVRRDLTVLVGYAWVPQFGVETVHEHRSWQQLRYAREDVPRETEARVRLEQRYLPEDEGTSWRLRGRLYGAFEFAEKWKWTIGDEIFLAMNAIESAAHGLDQNRFEVGVTRTLGERATFQPRYIVQYDKRTASGAEDVINHVMSISLELILR